jgi:type VI secretion system protein VasI
MPFCRNCGVAVPSTNQFCGKCGRPVSSTIAPERKRRSAGKIAGAVIIIVFGFLVLLGLFLSTFKPTTTASPPSTLGWNMKIGRSPMNDSTTVVLSLESEEVIRGPLGVARPQLILRCKEGKTAVYVVTRMAASVDRDLDDIRLDSHKVRIRLDEGAPSYQVWGESTDHEALFADDNVYDAVGAVHSYSGGAILLARQLRQAQTFTFEFTPFNGSPQVARFDIRGLDAHLPKLAEACGWAI